MSHYKHQDRIRFTFLYIVIIFKKPIEGEGELNLYGYVGGSPLLYSDPLGLTADCPTSCPSDNDPNWKPYVGNPVFFHCGFKTILENRTPTPDDPIAECVYDDKGNLVDDNHPYAGCKGTPDQYPATDYYDHSMNDSGGIKEHGWEGLKDSVKKHLGL